MVLNVVIVKGNKCDSFPVKWKLITHIKDLAKTNGEETQLLRVDLSISFVTSDSAIALVQLMKKNCLALGILNPWQRLCFQSNTGCKPIAGFRWKLQVQGVYKFGLGKERNHGQNVPISLTHLSNFSQTWHKAFFIFAQITGQNFFKYM